MASDFLCFLLVVVPLILITMHCVLPTVKFICLLRRDVNTLVYCCKCKLKFISCSFTLYIKRKVNAEAQKHNMAEVAPKKKTIFLFAIKIKNWIYLVHFQMNLPLILKCCIFHLYNKYHTKNNIRYFIRK